MHRRRSLSYLLAARHVLDGGQRQERLREVALPAAYLQRHALEVQLKDSLSAAYEINVSSEWLDLLAADENAPSPPERAIPMTHLHKDLLRHVANALSDIDFGPLPQSVTGLCDRIALSEAEAPERFRYQMVRFGKGGTQPLKRAFGQRETLKILETQNIMEDVFSSVFHFDEDVPEEHWTLWTKLAHRCYALGQTLLQNYPSTR